MVTDIPRLVRDLVPLARSAERMSVACVHTTRPKYLVFESDASRPSFVVQFGVAEQLERTHHALRHLHAQLPDVVAESLVCARFSAQECVHIQTGLAGLPWFRVADLCRTRADWVTLVQRCMGVLTRLQAVVGASRRWTGTLHPGQQLRDRLQTARIDIVNADSRTIARWADALDDVGRVAAAWQHGDFSVNNLLIDESGIGVIDFDEFGDTMMPLHDEMGLALSFPLSQHGVCPLTIKECLELCLAPALAAGTFGTDATRALLLHHLLWRIEQCRDCPQRDRLRATLTSYVHELIVRPEGLLGQSDLRPAIYAR
jgi:Phosphotransferase enzyme family